MLQIHGRRGIFDGLDSATSSARAAFEQWAETPLETRNIVIEAMRETTRRLAEDLSRRAVEETGLGNVKDKMAHWKVVNKEFVDVETFDCIQSDDCPKVQ